jgi:hypothetical protein
MATRAASVNTAIPPTTASLQNNPAGATTFGQISTPSSMCSRQRPRRSEKRLAEQRQLTATLDFSAVRKLFDPLAVLEGYDGLN